MKSKAKTSAIKLSNKHLNKLGKQGKLKQESHKKKLKERKLQKARNKSVNNSGLADPLTQIVEEDIAEEDAGFYSNKDQNSSFISTVKNRYRIFEL